MRILIITGGISSERRISFMSARQVKMGLEEKGHKIKLFDFKKGYVELKKSVKSFDVLFPVIHGEEGEGGDLQKFFKKIGKPYVGGDWRGYKKCWYKITFKIWCGKNGVLTAQWKTVKTKQDIIRFGFPCVLKSTNGGSSREVVILKSHTDLKNPQFKKLFSSNLPLFVEKYLPGIEITVAVLEKKALPVLEIISPSGWFDYKNKYWGNTKEIPFAPSVSKSIQKKAQDISQRIHQTFDLGQFSRTDFIISDGKPYALEVNTIPGLTQSSLFPKAAQAVGISFPELMDKIVSKVENKEYFTP